jgi:hypothetical protein
MRLTRSTIKPSHLKAKVKNQTLIGSIVGTKPLNKVEVPLICCQSNKPKFFESGYASGHANEVLTVHGLMDWLKGHFSEQSKDTGSYHYRETEKYRFGYAWTWIKWADKESLVFLSNVYDDRQDTFSLSN